mgnify:CR=1 FL=1
MAWRLMNVFLAKGNCMAFYGESAPIFRKNP